jgi:GNAT superfamily N-acetyltransferase
VSGIPERGLNGVLKTRLEPEQVEGQIEYVLGEFRKRGLPMTWNVGPGTRPAGLETALLRHGLHLLGTDPGLALDLATMNEETQPPANFTVETVENLAGLQEWTAAWTENMPEPTARRCREVYQALGTGTETSWRFYLGRVGREAVGTCQLFYAAGIVSVHHIATREKWQRSGIAKAMLVHALRKARQRGYRVAALTSTPAGLPLYTRMGFQTVATFSGYGW